MSGRDDDIRGDATGPEESLESRLSRLREDPRPPDHLEDRVLATLREGSLLEPDAMDGRRHRHTRPLGALAASMLLFVSGLLIGRYLLPVIPGPDSGTRYMLLLRESETAQDSETTRRRVNEYTAWARERRAAGSLVGGEKLADDVLVLSRHDGSTVTLDRLDPDVPATISGYFILTAEDREAAETIARTCPHLRHGGVVELRAIDRR